MAPSQGGSQYRPELGKQSLPGLETLSGQCWFGPEAVEATPAGPRLRGWGGYLGRAPVSIWPCLNWPWDIGSSPRGPWYLVLSKTICRGPGMLMKVLSRTKCLVSVAFIYSKEATSVSFGNWTIFFCLASFFLLFSQFTVCKSLRFRIKSRRVRDVGCYWVKLAHKVSSRLR